MPKRFTFILYISRIGELSMKAIEPKASQHRSCDIAETKDKIIVRTCGETKGDGGGVEDHGGLRSPLKHRSKFSKNASPSGKPTPRSSRLCYPPSLARIPSGSVALPDSVGKATKLERGQRWAVLGRLLMMAPSFLSFTNPSCQPSPPHRPRIQTLCLFSTLP